MGEERMTEERRNDTTDPLDVVKPILEPMPTEELKAVIERYPVVGSYRDRRHDSRRPYGAGTLLETTEGAYYLKKRPGGFRHPADIRWRHRVIEHLSTAGFPTPRPVPNESGDTLTETGEFSYELYEAAVGEDLYQDFHSWMPPTRARHARAAGETLARLHAALDDFPLEGVTLPGDSPMTPMSARFDLAWAPDLTAAVERRIEAAPALAGFFSEVPWKQDISALYADWHQRLLGYLPEVKPAVTHGDWHVNNLLFDGDTVSSAIDFHLCDVSFRMYDLAVALDRNGIPWLEILDGDPEAVRWDVLEELIRGYSSVLPLSHAEVELLTALLPVHQLDLAISNVEYYLAHEGNRERADWAYHVYLLGHARHFLTAPGGGILSFLRKAAMPR